jgi:HD-GYP domain-containing protein (c-di-GMP phosphodiesterase class II)
MERMMLINLSKQNSHVRVVMGALMVAVGTHVFWWILIPWGAMMLYTGITSTCTLTHFFSKPNKAALEHRYRSYLPVHNPQPVFVFGSDGALSFHNLTAADLLPDIKQFSDISLQNIDDLISHETTQSTKISLTTGKVYSVVFRGSRELNAIAAYATDITEVVKLNLEIIDTQKEVVYKMGEIGETRSRETGDHVRRVAEYSELLALLYGLTKEEAELIKLASPMHDIGKVGIPDAILKKPGRLDEAEFEVMKTHAEIGYSLLKNSHRPILKTAAIIALQHHEKWDGSGYPRQLAGEDIHIYGRITAVADVFDALGSARVYKEAWPLEKIMALFAEQRGIHFDPQLVDLLADHLDEFLAIAARHPN